MVLDLKTEELVTKVSDKVPNHRNAAHKGIMGKVRRRSWDAPAF